MKIQRNDLIIPLISVLFQDIRNDMPSSKSSRTSTSAYHAVEIITIYDWTTLNYVVVVVRNCLLCKIDTHNLQLFKTQALLLRINYTQWMRLVVYHPEFEECNRLVSFALLRKIVLRNFNFKHTRKKNNQPYPRSDTILSSYVLCIGYAENHANILFDYRWSSGSKRGKITSKIAHVRI